MKNYTFWLKSGQDLLDSLEVFARGRHVEAGRPYLFIAAKNSS